MVSEESRQSQEEKEIEREKSRNPIFCFRRRQRNISRLSIRSSLESISTRETHSMKFFDGK